MFKTGFKEKQKDADVDSVIESHFVGRHNTSLSGFLVAINRKCIILVLGDPGLRIAGAGGKPDDISNRETIALPNFK